MKSSIRQRIDRLAAQLKVKHRTFIIWGGCGEIDLEPEKQRHRDLHGPIADDEFVVVSWQAPLDPPGKEN